MNLDEQLAQLRQRVAAIDRRYAVSSGRVQTPRVEPITPERAEVPSYRHSQSSIEEWSSGQVVTNEFGSHFQSERLFAGHKCHGSADVGALVELADDFLEHVAEDLLRPVPATRWAFLDTETTGLAGGTGTYAFLIGVGRITVDGFRVRQFFMREYAEERSMLAALNQHLSEFDVLITYNGKSYDQPLLETRYRLARHKPPFSTLTHVDLLHGARRLWKLRLENCKLVELERQILGFERGGDIAGALIPYVYFEYLRARYSQPLIPIFHHNALDILTLACLTAIVPAAFRDTNSESLKALGIRRGEELAGIGRWLSSSGDHERAVELLKRAVQAGLADALLFRTLWDIALLEKKLKRPHAARTVLTELAGCRNDFRVSALEELAKFYEHEESNLVLALEFTNQALEYCSSDALNHRRLRLQKRLAKPRSRRLL